MIIKLNPDYDPEKAEKATDEYIGEVKHLFPMIGKDERNYLKDLRENILNFCDLKRISQKDDIAEEYGKPNEVVNEYFSSIDVENVVKKIKLSKLIRFAIIALLIIAFLALSVFSIYKYEIYQMALRTEIVDVEVEVGTITREEFLEGYRAYRAELNATETVS